MDPSTQHVVNILLAYRDTLDEEYYCGGRAVDLLLTLRDAWALDVVDRKSIMSRASYTARTISEYGHNPDFIPDVTMVKRKWEIASKRMKYSLIGALAAKYPAPSWYPMVMLTVVGFDLSEEN